MNKQLIHTGFAAIGLLLFFVLGCKSLPFKILGTLGIFIFAVIFLLIVGTILIVAFIRKRKGIPE